jgi:hypothetical protein
MHSWWTHFIFQCLMMSMLSCRIFINLFHSTCKLRIHIFGLTHRWELFLLLKFTHTSRTVLIHPRHLVGYGISCYQHKHKAFSWLMLIDSTLEICFIGRPRSCTEPWPFPSIATVPERRFLGSSWSACSLVVDPRDPSLSGGCSGSRRVGIPGS